MEICPCSAAPPAACSASPTAAQHGTGPRPSPREPPRERSGRGLSALGVGGAAALLHASRRSTFMSSAYCAGRTGTSATGRTAVARPQAEQPPRSANPPTRCPVGSRRHPWHRARPPPGRVRAPPPLLRCGRPRVVISAAGPPRAPPSGVPLPSLCSPPVAAPDPFLHDGGFVADYTQPQATPGSRRPGAWDKKEVNQG
ncbi:hypothetical protein BS78_07G138200 [Paspalum vaginatum]|nr:hypothetical protein BS78_07G138200 [Paspalum vaginatum]